MLWVFITSFTRNHKIIMRFSVIFALPSVLFQGICFYFSNLTENIYELNFENMYIYGFMNDFKYLELEYVIMIMYFTTHIFYDQQVKTKKEFFSTYKTQITIFNDAISKNKETLSIIKKENKKNTPENEMQFSKEHKISFTNVVIAIISKYSDIFSLFILFWISMYTVNVMHLILALFFMLFSIQLGTSISSAGSKSNGKSNTSNFVRRFWVFLIIYVNMLLFIRYLWAIIVVPYCGIEYSNYPAVIFIGITYDYEISPSLGLVKEGNYY